jgi:hypothetical protein
VRRRRIANSFSWQCFLATIERHRLCTNAFTFIQYPCMLFLQFGESPESLPLFPLRIDCSDTPQPKSLPLVECSSCSADPHFPSPLPFFHITTNSNWINQCTTAWVIIHHVKLTETMKGTLRRRLQHKITSVVMLLKILPRISSSITCYISITVFFFLLLGISSYYSLWSWRIPGG